jgi:hypothetical protein
MRAKKVGPCRRKPMLTAASVGLPSPMSEAGAFAQSRGEGRREAAPKLPRRTNFSSAVSTS